MGRHSLSFALKLLPIAAVLVFVSSGSYAPCIAELKLRRDILSVRVSHGYGSCALLLATAPVSDSLPQHLPMSDYASLAEEWGLEVVPETTFFPVDLRPAESWASTDITQLQVPEGKEVLVLCFVDGYQRQTSGSAELTGWVSDWAVITNFLSDGRMHPNRTTTKKIVDLSGSGGIAIAFFLFFGLILLGVLALVGIVVMFVRARQERP